jgi:quinoprotein glucose dehydrogenase
MRLPSRYLFMIATAVLLSTGLAAVGSLVGDHNPPYTTWSSYLGTPDSAQYSALTQINKSNVRQLEVRMDLPEYRGRDPSLRSRRGRRRHVRGRPAPARSSR